MHDAWEDDVRWCVHAQGPVLVLACTAVLWGARRSSQSLGAGCLAAGCLAILLGRASILAAVPLGSKQT